MVPPKEQTVGDHLLNKADSSDDGLRSLVHASL